MSAYSVKFVEQTGVGASKDIIFTNAREDFAALFCCYVTGEVTYDLEYTIDPSDNEQYIALGASGRTASSDDSLYFPVKKVRVNVTAGTGTVKLVTQYKD